jgi:hypothetical protein
MRRSLLLTLVLAVAATAAVLAATSSGSGGPAAQRPSEPTSFSASVTGAGGSSAAVAASSSTSSPDADPTTWGQARDREFGRRSRQRLARRLTRAVLASSAERLGVREDVLTDAVRKAAAAQRQARRQAGGLSASQRAALRACRRYYNTCDREAARGAYQELRAAWPGRGDLTRMRDDLASRVGRSLGRSRAEVLTAARDELEDRLRQGTALGVITPTGARVAMDCFDAPSACDLGELRRELRAGRLLG